MSKLRTIILMPLYLLSLLLTFTLFVPSSAHSKQIPKTHHYRFTYVDREDHTPRETVSHLSFLYGLSWGLYMVTQPDTIRNNGSKEKYKENFGKTVLFDRDRTKWNWFIHPFSGSQTYLYYRAAGYKRMEAFKLTFAQSLLFEYTAEIFTEPASFEDIFNTPVLGSLLGVFLEDLTMKMLNDGNALLRILGHTLNPATLFFFYEGKVIIEPNPSALIFQNNLKNVKPSPLLTLRLSY